MLQISHMLFSTSILSYDAMFFFQSVPYFVLEKCIFCIYIFNKYLYLLHNSKTAQDIWMILCTDVEPDEQAHCTKVWITQACLLSSYLHLQFFTNFCACSIIPKLFKIFGWYFIEIYTRFNRQTLNKRHNSTFLTFLVKSLDVFYFRHFCICYSKTIWDIIKY